MFDDLHLETADLIQTQEAASKILTESLTGNDTAAVISKSGGTNTGLTRDRGKLNDALDAAEAVQCAGIDAKFPTAARSLALSVAQQNIALAEQGSRTALGVIKLIVRKMESLPGQHSIVLISPGFMTLTGEVFPQNRKSSTPLPRRMSASTHWMRAAFM